MNERDELLKAEQPGMRLSPSQFTRSFRSRGSFNPPELTAIRRPTGILEEIAPRIVDPAAQTVDRSGSPVYALTHGLRGRSQIPVWSITTNSSAGSRSAARLVNRRSPRKTST